MFVSFVVGLATPKDLNDRLSRFLKKLDRNKYPFIVSQIIPLLEP